MQQQPATRAVQPAVRPAILVANPGALAKRGLATGDLHALLAEAGLAVRPGAVDLDGLEAALRDLTPGALVVVAGGDGTIHAAANRLAGTAHALAVLPLGTANDFARGLGVPADLARAAAIAATGAERRIDLGRVNGRYFLNAVHLGLGAETARRTDPRLKRWLGPIAYVVAALDAWREAAPLRLTLRVAGRKRRLRASQILVGSGRFFGGGNAVAPDAALDDGALVVSVVQPDLPFRALPRLAAALRRGELGRQPEAHAFRTAAFEVKLRRPGPVNLDGEVATMGGRLAFDVVRGALRVRAPLGEGAI